MPALDSRTAAHVLRRIGNLLELTGADRFRAKAYRNAARALLSLDVDDLTPLQASGALISIPDVGPATLSVIEELIQTGESSYLERLREMVPEALVELTRVPGLSASKVRLLYDEIDVRTLDDLEAATLDGRLQSVRGFGPKTVERIRSGIETLRSNRGLQLFPVAADEANRIAAMVSRHPDVIRAEPAGTVRRAMEVVGPIVVVAVCSNDPESVAHDFANLPIVRTATFPEATTVELTLVDEQHVQLTCCLEDEYPITLWRATGNAPHITHIRRHARTLGYRVHDTRLIDDMGKTIHLESERDLYHTLGLPWIAPELREGMGEVDAAHIGALPALITNNDITGVLHCHSTYSDGTATIADMAEAARVLGLQYIGISDHSVSAFYAGGLKPDDVLRQHEDIDRLNETYSDFRILKGIECDIRTDGSLDYESSAPTLLDRFDYVIGSIHSQFGMSESARNLADLFVRFR
jgi:DNA polymerase (family 10)